MGVQLYMYVTSYNYSLVGYYNLQLLHYGWVRVTTYELKLQFWRMLRATIRVLVDVTNYNFD